MRKSVIVIDDFYRDPFTVRAKALNAEFVSDVGSSYFLRTKSFLSEELILNLESIFGKELNLEDGNWDGSSVYNGTFYALDPKKNVPSHIHHDMYEMVGVICLDTTPPANKTLQDATCFWSHLRTGRSEAKDYKVVDKLCNDGADLRLWNCEDVIVHKFNRAIIYPGARFHSARITSLTRLNQLLAFSFK